MNEPSDLGLFALDRLFLPTFTDPEWILNEPRALTWWGSGLATRVRADAEREFRGVRVARVVVETDLARGTRTGVEADLLLAALARFSSLSGIVRDEETPGFLRLRSTVNVHQDLRDPCLRILLSAIPLQAEEALRLATPITDALGGEPARTPHPRAGRRQRPDDLLSLAQDFAAKGLATPQWTEEELRRLADRFNRPPCLLATAGSDAFTAEFPFLGESSLLSLHTGETHPVLGPGLLALLRIPPYLGKEEAATLAIRLNGLERDGDPDANFTGSWCAEGRGVVFVSFVPRLLRGGCCLDLVALNMALRARWVAEKVFRDDWDRVPAKSAIERFATVEVPS